MMDEALKKVLMHHPEKTLMHNKDVSCSTFFNPPQGFSSARVIKRMSIAKWIHLKWL
jgi:hypothetical protein